jgi:acyl dehydratase
MGRLFGEFTTGQRFETPGRTITETDIVAYAGLTGDYNPVHTDEVFAADTEFGTRIAHGPMGIGLVFGLASRLDLIDGTAVALLGVTWEFKAPVRPGDTVKALIEVISTRDVKNPDRGLLELGFTLVDQNGGCAERFGTSPDETDAASKGLLRRHRNSGRKSQVKSTLSQ